MYVKMNECYVCVLVVRVIWEIFVSSFNVGWRGERVGGLSVGLSVYL